MYTGSDQPVRAPLPVCTPSRALLDSHIYKSIYTHIYEHKQIQVCMQDLMSLCKSPCLCARHAERFTTHIYIYIHMYICTHTKKKYNYTGSD